MSDPRQSYAYRQIRNALRKRRHPCYICGLPIDYTAPKGEPLSFTADHVLPIATHRDKALDPTNIKAAHFQCNNRKQDGPAAPEIGTTSRSW